jgi:hypothetical protein
LQVGQWAADERDEREHDRAAEHDARHDARTPAAANDVALSSVCDIVRRCKCMSVYVKVV